MSLQGTAHGLIDPALLVEYMERFVGFGTYAADFWFVGMEQGGGADLGELARRLAAWDDLGRPEVADLRAYCARLGETRWHGPKARVQPTLGMLIRVVMAVHGTASTTERVREYQAGRFGRTEGETLIAELFPLPSRTVNDWIYAGITEVPYLRSRHEYLAALRPKRIRLLRKRLRDHQPRALILIGSSYREAWEALIGGRLTEVEAGILGVQIGRTRCLMVKHPTSFGATNAYFASVGRALARRS